MGDGNHRWQMLTILFSAVVETLGTVVIKATKIPQLHDVDYNLFESSKLGKTYRNILKVTLFLLFFFYIFILETYFYVSPLVGAFFLALTPMGIVIAAKHPATRTVLHSGWEPVITAMVISR